MRPACFLLSHSPTPTPSLGFSPILSPFYHSLIPLPPSSSDLSDSPPDRMFSHITNLISIRSKLSKNKSMIGEAISSCSFKKSSSLSGWFLQDNKDILEIRHSRDYYYYYYLSLLLLLFFVFFLLLLIINPQFIILNLCSRFKLLKWPNQVILQKN